MKSSPKYYLILFLTVAAYFGVSKFIFDKVYGTIHIVIDELFHIPQGLAYCERNFTYWNPKITTLPGLYLVSAAVLGSHFQCNTYNLRFINLIASCINLILFASILKFVYGNTSYVKTVWQALNLALLPPLYFFSHVYYTDTLSLTFLLVFSGFVNKFKLLNFIFGLCSVVMRQTNVVWVAMIFGHKLLYIFIKSSRVFGNQYLTKAKLSRQSLIAKDLDASKLKRYYGISDLFNALFYHITTCFVTFFKFITLQDFLDLFLHSITLISFLAFVYINGSIVVGDKGAHEAALHLPQLFYFLIFYAVFALPYVLVKLRTTLSLIFSNKIKVVFICILFVGIVHFNTIVHPYLLADNRHFTFYIWNRWYGKYDFAIYASVPIYVFLLFSLYDNLRQQNCISFLMPYTVCLFLVLALQKMLEVRYFIVPYIVLRLRFVRPSFKIILFEFVWYLTLNCAAFYVFFNKDVVWKDFDYSQRIIW
ncbi:putative Dol-P-Glc:Glc(2)Man(9)GlcNAc(2)-PP-Dol alpha-1,2-glucosyltransferase [Galleria mellonella]|uniref:Dol-P-Glc:Glc(2)Man(9)GlcNAc(2)-PP-Dol alpha-1,2-glucosyltransferase n=1 Tax=Galleria mellonella TaxID=7137 RepID=A0A6J1X244_GALME|nr:putative Dol-P-Glc:Glc(2)Man(9)GlcNAc(2)-PP-Dol alpha-1,2-glucosyltransferase [Galleria mellonella]XP_052757310.1 putative Dol-P-Glc:Glc(2)Man(9)GlcNAc(2)-PP-Dol alpha-1,2-glucosyltransferase [Galleria mellonella]